jgi:NAD+ synthase (glutamine-hydrolysing)
MSAPRGRCPGPFQSLYGHGFVRVAAAVPRVQVAEPAFNAERTLALARQASDADAALVLFPELGLSAYTNEDLFRQRALSDAVTAALERIVAESVGLQPLLVVGAPLQAEHGLFNTALVIHRGRVLGVVPKSYLPEYREYYEKRQFRAARDLVGNTIQVLGDAAPFGPDLLFASREQPDFVLHVEICEDLWVPIPPSTYGALAGATVLANLSASNITIGKADYRRQLCAAQSARMVAGYLYTAAGAGESTTDLAWDGQALIYENGDLLAETERFAAGEGLIIADVDLDRIVSERASTSSYGDSIHDHRDRLERIRRIKFDPGIRGHPVALQREIERFPYVPADPVSRSALGDASSAAMTQRRALASGSRSQSGSGGPHAKRLYSRSNREVCRVFEPRPETPVLRRSGSAPERQLRLLSKQAFRRCGDSGFYGRAAVERTEVQRTRRG